MNIPDLSVQFYPFCVFVPSGNIIIGSNSNFITNSIHFFLVHSIQISLTTTETASSLEFKFIRRFLPIPSSVYTDYWCISTELIVRIFLSLDFAVNCGMYLHYVSVRWIATTKDIRHICFRLIVLEGMSSGLTPCLQCICIIWNIVTNFICECQLLKYGHFEKIQEYQI